MNWKKINIDCSPEAFEMLGAVLMDIGITGFIINDPNNINELYNPNSAQWDYIDENLEQVLNEKCSLELYLPDDEQGAETLVNIKSSLCSLKQADFGFDLGSLKISLDTADDTTWLNEWKKYFKPMKVGERFYIRPSWEIISEKHNRYVIQMDPANSFGSGTHATTQLCLSAFERLQSEGLNILDIGCGSGILGIGAAISGAKSISFVDIDLHCIATSKSNAIDNHLDMNNLEFFCGNVLADNNLCNDIRLNKYHIIFANIMAEILIDMSPIFGKFLSDKGYIILSGIIPERLDAVKQAFEVAGYDIIAIDTKGGWCSVTVQIR